MTRCHTDFRRDHDGLHQDSITAFDFIRPKEEIPRRTIHNMTLQDLTNDNLLSSPISSYEIKVNPKKSSELHVMHPRPYSLQFKVIHFHLYVIQLVPNIQQSLKDQVETLRDETHELCINYASTRHELAQLGNKYAHLSNDFQILWDMCDANRVYCQEQEAEREAERQKMVDWETRSRIAQGEFLLISYVKLTYYRLF